MMTVEDEIWHAMSKLFDGFEPIYNNGHIDINGFYMGADRMFFMMPFIKTTR